jgi:phosphatidylglycerophosphate synthase
MLAAASGRTGGLPARLISHGFWNSAYTCSQWLLGIAAVLTIISGIRYLIDAWPLFRESAAEDVAQEKRSHVAIVGKR